MIKSILDAYSAIIRLCDTIIKKTSKKKAKIRNKNKRIARNNFISKKLKLLYNKRI